MRNGLVYGLAILLAWFSGSAALADDDKPPIAIRAHYELVTGTEIGQIVVQCSIRDGHHIYSLQQSTPPGPTKILVAASEEFELTAPFSAGQTPDVIEFDPVFEKRIEQFAGNVAFTAPLQLSAPADLEKLTIELTVSCQVCSDQECVPIRKKRVDVHFGGYVESLGKKKVEVTEPTTGKTGGKDD